MCLFDISGQIFGQLYHELYRTGLPHLLCFLIAETKGIMRDFCRVDGAHNIQNKGVQVCVEATITATIIDAIRERGKRATPPSMRCR